MLISIRKLRSRVASLGACRPTVIPAAVLHARARITGKKRAGVQEGGAGVREGGAGVDVLTRVPQVAVGRDAERAHSRQHPTLAAVDLVGPVSVTNRFAFTAAREIEAVREDVAMVAVADVLGITSTATASAESTPSVAGIVTSVNARVVAIEHRPPRTRQK
jgi:hypothetical protein